MKSIFAAALLIAGFVLPLAAANAEALPDCQDWPTIYSAETPRNVATGLPFTYNARFHCALGAKYSVKGVEGAYASYQEESQVVLPSKVIFTHPLAANELLYLFMFEVAEDQKPGSYLFQGCLRIDNNETAESLCIELPLSEIEIVSVPKMNLPQSVAADLPN